MAADVLLSLVRVRLVLLCPQRGFLNILLPVIAALQQQSGAELLNKVHCTV